MQDNKNKEEILTQREFEILKLVSKGLTNKEIAKFLMISHHTVKVHVGAIIRKMEVRNRLDISMKAKDLGLIP